LGDVAVAASDENDLDVALDTWKSFDTATRAAVGNINVHGCFGGTEPYRGPNRSALREATRRKRLWQSEYGENDGSGFTMARSIILDIRDLQPSAWVYWQPIEPGDNGWGLMLAKYENTGDQLKSHIQTQLARVNRKFFVYGQFTRYIRPGYHVLGIDHARSIAAYNAATRKLVIVTISGVGNEKLTYDPIEIQNGRRDRTHGHNHSAGRGCSRLEAACGCFVARSPEPKTLYHYAIPKNRFTRFLFQI
jgi:galactan endo-1,6-beta-galactosidase